MLKSKTKIFVAILMFAILLIPFSPFLVEICYLFKPVEIENDSVPKLRFGHQITIIIDDSVINDAEYVEVTAEKYENTKMSPIYFDMIATQELKQLIEYMEENNFAIKPGKYVINTAWTFKEIIEVLEFVEK